MTIALVAMALTASACVSDSGDGIQPSSTTTSSVVTDATPGDSPSTTLGSTTPSERGDPVEGWGRLDVQTDEFGGVVPVNGAAEEGVVVLVGCQTEDLPLFPIWYAENGLDFQRANGPDVEGAARLGCIEEVVSTPFGWFAGGAGTLLTSPDGMSWDVADVPFVLGYEVDFQLGYADNLFVSPDGSRLTVLYRRAAQAESTVATFVSTTDGENWVENAHPSQSLFDSSNIRAVIEGGDGLLAAGSSPGGEFVPTAAVFTSPDGLRWRRVTPEGQPDFADKVIEDVIDAGDRFVAVGGDFFQTGLMTAWVSPDGIQWRRVPHPAESTDPSVAQMTGESLTIADGYIWASGRDFDARRNDPQGLPAIWRSLDGEAWQRIPLDELEINVPFEVVSTPDIRLGVWPAPSGLIDEPLTLYAAD